MIATMIASARVAAPTTSAKTAAYSPFHALSAATFLESTAALSAA